MHIGQKIKQLRLLQQIKQSDLAKMVSRTRGLISQIEKTGKVNYYTLQAIATALKTSPEELQSFQPDKFYSLSISQVAEASGKYPNQTSVSALLKELDYSRDLIQQQKKIIELLEQRIENMERELEKKRSSAS